MAVHLADQQDSQIVELRFRMLQMLSALPLDRNFLHQIHVRRHLLHPVPVRMMGEHLVKMLVVQLEHQLDVQGL
jgi:hypothetical protein